MNCIVLHGVQTRSPGDNCQIYQHSPLIMYGHGYRLADKLPENKQDLRIITEAHRAGKHQAGITRLPFKSAAIPGVFAVTKIVRTSEL